VFLTVTPYGVVVSVLLPAPQKLHKIALCTTPPCTMALCTIALCTMALSTTAQATVFCMIHELHCLHSVIFLHYFMFTGFTHVCFYIYFVFIFISILILMTLGDVM
jgi:hypothetical protein